MKISNTNINVNDHGINSNGVNDNAEPNTLETLQWPHNVLVFHPPNLDGPPEIVDKKIFDIQQQIAHTQDPQIPNPFNADQNTFTSNNHFAPYHYALLFAPGTYPNCNFEIGYYVQMLGLGAAATDVKFTSTKDNQPSGPFVPALNKHLSKASYSTIAHDGSGLCLDTFWRAAENFCVDTPYLPFTWAVSQAAPLRRVDVTGDLHFGDGEAYASGGVLANAQVGGVTNFVAQQQWYTRHAKMSSGIDGGSWNLVFTGCVDGNNASFDKSGQDPKVPNKFYTSEVKPKNRLEKPFITLEYGKKWVLRVPQPITDNADLNIVGPHLMDYHAGEARDFANVKVAIPRPDGEKDPNDIDAYNSIDHVDWQINRDIQQALDDGKDVVLCPGTFFLTKPLIVKKPNQVILGLGLATLVAPQNGAPCIRVKANTPGVRIAGITLAASAQQPPSSLSISKPCFSILPSSLLSMMKQKNKYDDQDKNSDGVSSLLEIGEPGKTKNNKGDNKSDESNPCLLSDIFARVGGMNLDRINVKTNVMIRIHSDNVIGDNLWLWRADHVKLDVANGEQPNDIKLPLYHQTRYNKQHGVFECAVDTALEVYGDNVQMYGLFCEHTLKDQLIWSGDNGSVSFYQCELPYDVYQKDFTKSVGYRVLDHVKTHNGQGVGVYCNFQVDEVQAIAGIIRPNNKNDDDNDDNGGINIRHPFTIFLDGMGRIQTVIKSSNDERTTMATGVPVTLSSKVTPSRPSSDLL